MSVFLFIHRALKVSCFDPKGEEVLGNGMTRVVTSRDFWNWDLSSVRRPSFSRMQERNRLQMQLLVPFVAESTIASQWPCCYRRLSALSERSTAGSDLLCSVGSGRYTFYWAIIRAQWDATGVCRLDRRGFSWGGFRSTICS